MRDVSAWSTYTKNEIMRKSTFFRYTWLLGRKSFTLLLKDEPFHQIFVEFLLPKMCTFMTFWCHFCLWSLCIARPCCRNTLHMHGIGSWTWQKKGDKLIFWWFWKPQHPSTPCLWQSWSWPPHAEINLYLEITEFTIKKCCSGANDDFLLTKAVNNAGHILIDVCPIPLTASILMIFRVSFNVAFCAVTLHSCICILAGLASVCAGRKAFRSIS